MALVGITRIFGPVSIFSTARYKSFNIDFDDTKIVVIVDLHPLCRLSFYFGFIQIHHSSSLSPPLWCG